jgi:hypothetical protein
VKEKRLIKYLKWDSEFFDMKIRRVIVKDNNCFELKNFWIQQEEEQFDLIYGISENHFLINFWEKMNFYFVDCLVTLSMDFRPEEYKHQEYVLLSKLSEEDLKDCYQNLRISAPFFSIL